MAIYRLAKRNKCSYTVKYRQHTLVRGRPNYYWHQAAKETDHSLTKGAIAQGKSQMIGMQRTVKFRITSQVQRLKMEAPH